MFIIREQEKIVNIIFSKYAGSQGNTVTGVSKNEGVLKTKSILEWLNVKSTKTFFSFQIYHRKFQVSYKAFKKYVKVYLRFAIGE